MVHVVNTISTKRVCVRNCITAVGKKTHVATDNYKSTVIVLRTVDETIMRMLNSKQITWLM